MKRTYTFKNLTLYPGNQKACTAAYDLVESGKPADNPLYIYGRTGLGKTHILQAVRQQVTENHPNSSIIYMTCEEFCSELSRFEFMVEYQRYSGDLPDFFVLDNVQEVTADKSAPQLLADLVKVLYNRNRKIILAADIPLYRLQTLFLSQENGPIIRCKRIDPPNLPERILLCWDKCKELGIDFPDEIIWAIAADCDGSICSMEGALTTISTYGKLMKTEIDLSVCEMILKRFKNWKNFKRWSGCDMS